MNSLEDLGYRVSDSPGVRRKALSSAIRKIGDGKVKKRLQSRKYRASGYKARRYRADLNWMEERGNSFGFDFF